jgi:hypothetical protein
VRASARDAAAFSQAKRFALTIAAVLCLLVERTIALDAFGPAGAIFLTLLRAFLIPFNFIHHALFRLSIVIWAQSTPAWWNWLSTLLGLLIYVLIDLLLAVSRAERIAVQ